MENFFNWLSKPIPKDEIVTWFNVHNMYYEKIELYGDIFKSLNQIIVDTYLGSDVNETKIVLSEEDNISHFDWCWKKTVENFQIIDDVVLYDFMNQYSNVHFENQEAGFVVPYAQIQKSYKTFVNSQMENDKDWWKF